MEKIEFETKREDLDLVVRMKGQFVIPYEGSGEWLLKLKQFIDEQAI